MNKVLPLFITFHAEPNGLYVKKNDNSNWTGFEKALETITSLRRANRISSETKFVWLVRADSQIEILYGKASWGLENYKAQISELINYGDELGIHVHSYKYLEAENRWIQDLSDVEYINSSITIAHKSFNEVLNFKPLSLSIGPNSTTIDIVNHCRKLGIKFDYTISNNGKRTFNQEKGEIRGEMQWFKNLPSQPYTPSIENIKTVEKTRDDYCLIPVHYFLIKHGPLNIKGLINKHFWGREDYRKVKPSLSMNPQLFREILERARKKHYKYLLIDTRTHIFLKPDKLENITANLEYLNKWKGVKYEVIAPNEKNEHKIKM